MKLTDARAYAAGVVVSATVVLSAYVLLGQPQPSHADVHGLPCSARYVDMGVYYDQVHGYYVQDDWVYDSAGLFCRQFSTRHLDPIPDPNAPVNHEPQTPHRS